MNRAARLGILALALLTSSPVWLTLMMVTAGIYGLVWVPAVIGCAVWALAAPNPASKPLPTPWVWHPTTTQHTHRAA